jgi:hypothetical protein
MPHKYMRVTWSEVMGKKEWRILVCVCVCVCVSEDVSWK